MPDRVPSSTVRGPRTLYNKAPMPSPLHRYLDGDLSGPALLPEQQAHLREMEEAIDLATARARTEAAPDLTDQVMAAISRPEPAPTGAPDPGLLSRLAAGLWSPWQVTIRPVYGLAAAMSVLLIAALIPLSPGDRADVPLAVDSSPERLFVQFRLEAAGASSVSLAGSFTGWEASHSLVETAPGTWTVLIPLEPGVHDYLFVVDGREWVPDPVASPVEDGFGGTNSRLFLVPPSRGT